MDVQWRMVLFDLFLGLSPLVTIGPLFWRDPRWWHTIPTVLVAIAWAGLRYVDEQENYPLVVDALADRPFLLAVLAFGVGLPLLVGLVFVPVLGDVVVAGTIGMGLGHAGYRLLYGVVRPAPDRAIERSERGSL